MNIRARVKGGFYYPDGNTPRDLIEFWSVIEGYRLKGVDYEIEHGSAVVDKNYVEIFENDVLELEEILDGANEVVNVSFDEGAFLVENVDTGFVLDLVQCIPIDGELDTKIEIVGYAGTN